MSVAFYPRTGVVLYASEPAALKAAVGAALALSVSFVVSNEAGQFEGLRPNRHVYCVGATGLSLQLVALCF